jgi:flagellar secretion chaperone FliS
MPTIAPEEYLVTEVMTAPPQKLQLMLIEAALRCAARARAHWRVGENVEAGEALLRCQQIVTEILSGIRPDADRALAGKISSIYTFVFRTLVAAHLRADTAKLDEAIRVLQVERETWQMLCARLADAAPPADTPLPHRKSGFSLQA